LDFLTILVVVNSNGSIGSEIDVGLTTFYELFTDYRNHRTEAGVLRKETSSGRSLV
jgi:hypothetical protein